MDEDPLKKWFAWQRRQHTEKVTGNIQTWSSRTQCHSENKKGLLLQDLVSPQTLTKCINNSLKTTSMVEHKLYKNEKWQIIYNGYIYYQKKPRRGRDRLQ
jgi:hypothetical protein